jgi:hypothetical protein
MCFKGACDTAIGFSFGLMTGLDIILENKGKDPLFLPFIADILLPNTKQDKL